MLDSCNFITWALNMEVAWFLKGGARFGLRCPRHLVLFPREPFLKYKPESTMSLISLGVISKIIYILIEQSYH